ncbi:hypothetical protein FVE85_2682 [Porphyridium purpureum]|uniref:MRPL25 domain-containing protein n=1 Tax=Porphyridium purpureum TaxID=35688 RepID=A0A5J4YSG7_PORPP|nr:hypothetical protein FVE85_2682 [Porphyridium purpureum]|eukprot:POR1313..scf227_4
MGVGSVGPLDKAAALLASRIAAVGAEKASRVANASYVPRQAAWKVNGRVIPRKVTVNREEVEAAIARLPPEFKRTKLPSGKWLRAKWSKLKISRLRRKFERLGKEWPWHVPKKIVHYNVPLKGTIQERTREARLKLIEENMRKMPQWIAEYRAERAALPKKWKEGTPALAIRLRGGTLVEIDDAEKRKIKEQAAMLRTFVQSMREKETTASAPDSKSPKETESAPDKTAAH